MLPGGDPQNGSRSARGRRELTGRCFEQSEGVGRSPSRGREAIPGTDNVGWEFEPLEVGGEGPSDGVGFVGELERFGAGAEKEEEVVVEVVRLVVFGRDAVDVGGEEGGGGGVEGNSGFLEDFAGGGVG